MLHPIVLYSIYMLPVKAALRAAAAQQARQHGSK